MFASDKAREKLERGNHPGFLMVYGGVDALLAKYYHLAVIMIVDVELWWVCRNTATENVFVPFHKTLNLW